MKYLVILSCVMILVSCDGVYRTYDLCPNLVFQGNSNHLNNEVGYRNEFTGEVLISTGIDLVLKNTNYVIIRQINSIDGYCTPKYRTEFDSLRKTNISHLYWIVHLDRVPRQLEKNEHDERLETFLDGPYDEETAITECQQLGVAVRRTEIVYGYEIHYIPRWMNPLDTSYFQGGRRKRIWEWF